LLSNPVLETTLPTNVNFTQKEQAAFGIAHLHFDDYIMSQINDVAHYFRPAASKFELWACQSEASKKYKQTILAGRFKQPRSGCQKGESARDGRHSRNLANWNGKAQSVVV